MNDVAAVTATAALAALVALVVLVPGDGGTSALVATATIVREATGVLVVACALVSGIACAALGQAARAPLSGPDAPSSRAASPHARH